MSCTGPHHGGRGGVLPLRLSGFGNMIDCLFPFTLLSSHKSYAKIPFSIIIQPLVLFNAIKIVLYQQPYAVLTA